MKRWLLVALFCSVAPAEDACKQANHRYVQTAASAEAARGILDELRQSLQSQGLTLRADYSAREVRIRLRLDQARRAIEAKRCKAATEPLTIAAEEVRRLLRELGQ